MGRSLLLFGSLNLEQTIESFLDFWGNYDIQKNLQYIEHFSSVCDIVCRH